MTTIWGQASGRMVSSQKTGKMEPPPPPTLPFSSLVILSFFFFFHVCIYSFIFGRAGSSLLHVDFLSLQQSGAAL